MKRFINNGDGTANPLPDAKLKVEAGNVSLADPNPNAILYLGKMNIKVCPTCGAEYGECEGLCVSTPQYTGDYCLSCWAKWISENIPKLVPKKEGERYEIHRQR